jgi:hypothetical protein
MKSILDPAFSYTSSAQTDVRKTFARIRRELCAEERGRARSPVPDVGANGVPGRQPQRVVSAYRR